MRMACCETSLMLPRQAGLLVTSLLQFYPGLPQQQAWDQNPQAVEEHQIDPKVEPAVGVEVGASDKPLREEGHPAAIELTHAGGDLYEMPVILLLDYGVNEDQCQEPIQDNSQDFQRHNGWIKIQPSCVSLAIFFP